jgi:membrane-bound metal-dependent hydrolase YbcI (DUF457 family)
MAGFKTHIGCSTVLGIGYGAAGAIWLDMPVPSAILAAGLCSVSGMLPDVDSDSGVPLRESICFGAAVVPMMLWEQLRQANIPHEIVVLIGMGTYLFIRFVLATIIKHLTVHRGMFHSIPAAAIAGELVYLITAGQNEHVRWFKAVAVVAGYLCHLVLDEIWSFQVKRGLITTKASFGTALKFIGDSWLMAVPTYAILAVLSYAVCQDPATQRILNQQATQVAKPPAQSGTGNTPAPQSPVERATQKLGDLFRR